MRQSVPGMIFTNEVPTITMKYFAVNTVQNGEQGKLLVFTDHRKAEASYVTAINQITNNQFVGYDEASRYYQNYRDRQDNGIPDTVIFYSGDINLPTSRLALNGILLSN